MTFDQHPAPTQGQRICQASVTRRIKKQKVDVASREEHEGGELECGSTTSLSDNESYDSRCSFEMHLLRSVRR